MKLIKVISTTYTLLILGLVPVVIYACKAKRTVNESAEVLDSIAHDYPQLDISKIDTNYVNLTDFAGKVFPIAKYEDMSNYNGEYFRFGPITTPTQDVNKYSECIITKVDKNIPSVSFKIELENLFGDTLTNVIIRPVIIMTNSSTGNNIFKTTGGFNFELLDENQSVNVSVLTLLDFGYDIDTDRNYPIYLGNLGSFIDSFIVLKIEATAKGVTFNENFYYSLKPAILKCIKR